EGDSVRGFTPSTRFARAGWVAAAAVTALVVVSGCQNDAKAQNPSGSGSSSSSSSSSSTSNGPVSLAITPANGSSSVAPNTTVKVTAEGGPIASVTVTDAKNRSIAGSLSSDGLSWTASRYLRPSTHYTV